MAKNMSDIDLLIKIPEEEYIDIKDTVSNFITDVTSMRRICLAIRNGTRLPKEHGRLKDVDAFITKVKADREHACYVRSWTADDVLEALDNSYAPTIIDAESENKIWIVTYWTTEIEPVVTPFDNQEAAETCVKYYKRQGYKVCVDKCDIFHKCTQQTESDDNK